MLSERVYPALIALGANLPSEAGNPAQTLHAALAELDTPSSGLSVATVSRFFATPCFPAGAGPDYVNAAAVLHSAIEPQAILARLHAIEKHYGRIRETRWAGRTLDLDLLAFGSSILPDPATWHRWRDMPQNEQARTAPDRLILPHPRLQDRGFVLVPLADIAADWIHPVSGLSVANMLAALPESEKSAITPL